MDLLRGSVDSLLRGSDDWVDVDCDGPGAVIFGADPAAASDNPSAPAGSGAAALEEDELAQQADASEEGIGAVAGGEGMVTVDAYRGAAASSGIQTTSTLQATLLLLKSRGRFIESSNRDCATLLIHAEHLQGIVDTSRSLTRKFPDSQLVRSNSLLDCVMRVFFQSTHHCPPLLTGSRTFSCTIRASGNLGLSTEGACG